VTELLGLRTTLIPPHPGNVSAFGLLAVDLKSDYVATVVQREDRFDRAILESAYVRLEAAADHELGEQGVSLEHRRFLRSADLRYFGQGYETRVDLPAGPLSDDGLRSLVDRFHGEHQRLYGYTYRGTQLVELVNVRVTSIGCIDRPPVTESAAGSPTSAAIPCKLRPVYLGGQFVDCPIYRRSELALGHVLSGPAVVEEYGSTTVIQLGQSVLIDTFGNMLLAPITDPSVVVPETS
jgi:N-methylhydantoinase A